MTSEQKIEAAAVDAVSKFSVAPNYHYPFKVGFHAGYIWAIHQPELMAEVFEKFSEWSNL
jgi:hypothetical protein